MTLKVHTAFALYFKYPKALQYIGSSVQPITMYTDHNPLVFLQRMSNANHRLMRWALICQGFNLNIQHKKGVENVIADTLSRIHS